LLRPLWSKLVPYTTLFRSADEDVGEGDDQEVEAGDAADDGEEPERGDVAGEEADAGEEAEGGEGAEEAEGAEDDVEPGEDLNVRSEERRAGKGRCWRAQRQ